MVRKKHVARNQRGIIGTPPAVRGRKHENVQTEKYLEEVSILLRPRITFQFLLPIFLVDFYTSTGD